MCAEQANHDQLLLNWRFTRLGLAAVSIVFYKAWISCLYHSILVFTELGLAAISLVFYKPWTSCC